MTKKDFMGKPIEDDEPYEHKYQEYRSDYQMDLKGDNSGAWTAFKGCLLGIVLYIVGGTLLLGLGMLFRMG